MNKKLILGLTAIMTAFSLAACGSSDESDTKIIEMTNPASSSETADMTTASDSGYTLEYNGLTIAVDADASPIIEALGEPSEYFESPSCAGEGIGKLYTYSDIEIQTYPDGDNDLILYVLLRTDNVATKEGIDLSSTMDEVKAVYGDPSSENSGALTYEKDGMTLNFLFSGEDMISIEYDSSKN